MINIIKMDLYKMFKSKNFYVVNVVLIVLVLSLAILMKASIGMSYDTAKKANFFYDAADGIKLDTTDPSLTEERYYAIQKARKNSANVDEFIMFQYAGPVMVMLMTVFMAIFICSEWDTGFIKNIIPLKNSRASLLVSKNTIAFLFILLEGFISMTVAIGANLIISGKVNILEFKEIIIYIGFQLLLLMAFASLLILISYLFRSKSLTILIGFLLGQVNIHSLLLKQLDNLINLGNINLSDLSIINNMRELTFSPEIGDYKRVIVISVAYFLVYNIISLFKLKRIEAN